MAPKNIVKDYYDNNAQTYCDSTLNVDLSEIHDVFYSYLKRGSRILDAGCGSGRDIIAFQNMGHTVDAFDISAEIAEIAAKNSGIDVEVSTFLEYQTSNTFDAIWCCASLLHVPLDDMVRAMRNLSKALTHNGIWYVSFKYGNNEQIRSERHFTDLNETSLVKLIDDAGDLKIIKTWTTDDARPDRDDKWLNAILKKTQFKRQQ